MRVLQLIDSLETGGAERVAVNFANALATRLDKSYLCATRKEGILKSSLNNAVGYLFLKKVNTLDFKAILKLNTFVKKNKIACIHAHASSFFLATLIKILNPKLKLIWHEHYGNRSNTPKFNQLILKIASLFFNKILVVSQSLKDWCDHNLYTQDVQYLSNYAVYNPIKPQTILKGKENKRLVCIANLKPDKDHLNLLKAFKLLENKNPEWTLHVVGKIFNDAYYESITNYIYSKNLKDSVYFYGSCNDVFNILSQANIAVLASKSEGLPVSLLEYGLAQMPVVVTNVGYCNRVVSHNTSGFVVESKNSQALCDALHILMNHEGKRHMFSKNLKNTVQNNYSEESTIKSLLQIYNRL